MSPPRSIVFSSRESYSNAVTQNVPAPTSTTPSASMCSVISGASGTGSSADTEPSTAITPSGRLSTIPSCAVISVGVPQPASITGPITVLPSRSGK